MNTADTAHGEICENVTRPFSRFFGQGLGKGLSSQYTSSRNMKFVNTLCCYDNDI